MITTLTATTTSRIVSRLVEHEGTSGSSRVLTLVISTDEKGLEDALCAAHGASRDHPSRIIAVVKPPEEDTSGRVTPRSRDGHVPAQAGGHLDAEIRVGHDAGAGETLVLRPWDEAALHTDTLVVPFLLPDAPVVVWWPTTVPEVPSQDPLGRLGSTRITNTPAQDFPARALRALAPVSVRGDLDPAWTRLTLWRTQLAALMEQMPSSPVRRVVVWGSSKSPSVVLLGTWLGWKLEAPVHLATIGAANRGLYRVSIEREDGSVTMFRPGISVATISTPYAPNQQIALPVRTLAECISEELRRLDPDDTYGDVLKQALRTVTLVDDTCQPEDMLDLEEYPEVFDA